MAKDLIAAAIQNSTDVHNPHVRDISVYEYVNQGRRTGSPPCTLGNVNVKLTVAGECWENVHYEEYNVYDFSGWVKNHDGNSMFPLGPNPIAKWAQNGFAYLQFPASHTMDRWTAGKSGSTNIVGPLARLGDTVDFKDLATTVQSVEVGQYLGAVEENNAGFEACGSPGEAANDPKLGFRYLCTPGP